MSPKHFPPLLLTLCLLVAQSVSAASRRPVQAADGMVVSSSPVASRVGVGILRQGGNAVDAAVAVGFALAVVHPSAGNVGGGGFMTLHLAESNGQTTVDFRETAPASAFREMYLDDSGEVVPGLSTRSHLASGVPGSVAGLHLAWRRWGTLAWSDLIAPAIQLAGEGFIVSADLSESLSAAQELLSGHPESRRIFLRDGRPYQEGELFVQPELARTLRRIAEDGPDAFYRGEIARLIEQEMYRGQNGITREDLASYRPLIREPIRGEYKGLDIVSMAPPSSGGAILIQMLNILERFPLATLGHGSSISLHLQAETMRLAFADRAHYFGDPDFVTIPLRRLLSGRYAQQQARGIRTDLATPSRILRGGLPSDESEDTTHYSVVDRARNAVAVTTTINGSYGSGITIPGAGFLMNNEMDDFTSRPNTPNMFGLIQGEANSIQPGKRPLSAMTPTIVLREGSPYLVLGSPGGPTIINTVLQILLNVVDYGLNIQEAVDAPRIHHQWMPDELVLEEQGIPVDVEVNLRRRGHRIRFRSTIGDAHCILIDPETGMLQGAADPRRGGEAVGWSDSRAARSGSDRSDVVGRVRQTTENPNHKP